MAEAPSAGTVNNNRRTKSIFFLFFLCNNNLYTQPDNLQDDGFSTLRMYNQFIYFQFIRARKSQFLVASKVTDVDIAPRKQCLLIQRKVCQFSTNALKILSYAQEQIVYYQNMCSICNLPKPRAQNLFQNPKASATRER